MKFLKRIYEIFNTKNYKWVRNPFGKKAQFNINNEIYEVCFDEISTNVYNHYFYLIRDGVKYFDLIKSDDNRSFQVLGNVKNIIKEFLQENIYVEFIGFSSSEKERNDLYILYAQYIRGS